MYDAFSVLSAVRAKKPLVHHITNWVTIYDCAQITRSCGALPVMAHAPEEVEEMVSLAGALVLNIGTLTSKLIDSMILAGEKANALGIPVVLDAVGAGATKFRTAKCAELMEKVRFTVIKGNSSEIGALAGAKALTRGVEAEKVEGSLLKIAEKLAKEKNCIVVITGKEDIVSNGTKTLLVKNGHELMGKIVGTGCMAASVLGAFNAVEKDSLKASACALACYGIAGEIAAKKAKAPMKFKVEFFDALYLLSEKDLKKAKIEECK
ncbi:MAG: hydroxyethylthiazole kinase [Candidatus Diapherotrites archaeon]|nr:hydroxyethylthiazole kinase [Candidatus Diapherotrites archaeon]